QRHPVPLLAPEFGVRLPAVGPRAIPAEVGGLRARLLQAHGRHRHRAQHEGLLLGPAPQAGIRHHRAARLRHPAHGRACRGPGGLPASP
ncbi:hypothetical protein LTR94_036558, partial [Friedmanniomyces endolithicus]